MPHFTNLNWIEFARWVMVGAICFFGMLAVIYAFNNETMNALVNLTAMLYFVCAVLITRQFQELEDEENSETSS